MLFPASIPARWTVDSSGIEWRVERSAPAHIDRIETSGERCSLILGYGTGEGGVLVQEPRVVWPMLRTLPNDTHASLQAAFGREHRPTLTVDGVPVTETLERVRLDGVIHLTSRAGPIEIRRSWSVDRERPYAIERLVLKNLGERTVQVALSPAERSRQTDPAKGLQGAYTIQALAWKGETASLRPKGTRELAIDYVAYPTRTPLRIEGSPADAEKARRLLVRELDGLLDLRTPDPNVDRMFRFAKIRAAESLFRTKGGLIHSPGGGAYYAAIWANDQAEYANPLFGYLGYDRAQEAAETSWDWFARYMNPEYKPIPASIIAEGASSLSVAGDRGDMAMIAYGATRYALARGDRTVARRLWPLVEWCLEYLRRKKSPEGILLSDSDELENRFPSGKANLNTSCLAYDGLLSAAALAEDLGENAKAADYRGRAADLRGAIDRYFGARVEGFETYRYYEGNDVLRAWIATPLTVGIFKRARGTTDALFSPRLWTPDGLASLAGNATFWDRATLYGLRGALAAGETERALPRLLDYTNRRLTGEHVPYAVEAYPEGDQRHLSAESALYVRAITEGMFGLRPRGLRRFEVDPRLPQAWRGRGMSLRNVSIAGTVIGVTVKGDRLNVTVKGQRSRSYPLGAPVVVDLTERARD